MYAASTLGDGNCLFRALSDQLYGSDTHHLKLRSALCNWIESHKERYAPFVDDERGLDVHLQCMRQPGEFIILHSKSSNIHFNICRDLWWTCRTLSRTTTVLRSRRDDAAASLAYTSFGAQSLGCDALLGTRRGSRVIRALYESPSVYAPLSAAHTGGDVCCVR